MHARGGKEEATRGDARRCASDRLKITERHPGIVPRFPEISRNFPSANRESASNRLCLDLALHGKKKKMEKD